MNSRSHQPTNLSIVPLGAGDLIDRAVRFYRKNFWTFVWIAAPPVLIGMIISVCWLMIGRRLFSFGAGLDEFEQSLYYIFLWLGNVLIWLVQTVATLTVMGGASRNFVRHLLFGEPVTFRETYKNARRRFFGLVGASVLITALLGVAVTAIIYFGLIVGALGIVIIAGFFSFFPPLAFILAAAVGIAAGFVTLWLAFLVISRFVYVPQIITVEERGVFSAIGRSASLASGNVRRLAALFIFTTAAAYSALAILYVPLGWYAWANGIEIFGFDPDATPVWYQIAGQVISQSSLILLSPVWMIGLCLLYVDERVRHEGYDIELMAARRLGEIPDVPPDFVNPLQPALANQTAAEKRGSAFTPLGLK
jgi:hypothetical protein